MCDEQKKINAPEGRGIKPSPRINKETGTSIAASLGTYSAASSTINKKQEIILIAAMAENRVIGKDNAMPFSVKGNLARFKEITMGWPCVMGRKTWESLPKKPLSGRLNVVISKTMHHAQLKQCAVQDNGFYDRNSIVKICASIQDAVNFCSGYGKIFICGGESIYKQFMPLADRIDLTLVAGQYEGDAFFPEIDENIWIKTKSVNFENFKVITYKKINQE